jgi:fructose-1,6-bisphosphatase II
MKTGTGTEGPLRNLGLDLARATEAAAIAAGRWVGLGKPAAADADATQAMCRVLSSLRIDGRIVMGKERRLKACDLLLTDEPVGTGTGPQLDIVADAIDGRVEVARGHQGAIAVIAGTPRGAIWHPPAGAYLDKLVVNAQVGAALVPECMDAPAAWTLALVGRAKGKPVRELRVFLLERPRHATLIEEIRRAGAHVVLRDEGDITGALMAGLPDGSIDILMGVGGIPEGLIAACLVKAMGGAMLGRLAPQREEEQQACESAGLDTTRILTTDELVAGDEIVAAATGITDGPMFEGVKYQRGYVSSNSFIVRGATGTRRTVFSQHVLEAGEQAPD